MQNKTKTVGRCPTPRTRRGAGGPGVKTPGPPAGSVVHLRAVKGSLRRRLRLRP